jgi:hypothetical protein
MMRLTHYCGVCRRDTTDEAKPFHRHIARYYGWQTDTMYLAMHDGTSQLLTACIEAQDPASQVIVDPSEPPAELGDIEATRLAYRRLRTKLGLPPGTSLVRLLTEAAQRLAREASLTARDSGAV